MKTVEVEVNLIVPPTTVIKYDGKEQLIYKIKKDKTKRRKYSTKTRSLISADEERPLRVYFGRRGRTQNLSKKQTERYYKRAFMLKDGSGNLTINNRLKANFWSTRVLWPNTYGIREVVVEKNDTKYVFKIKKQSVRD